MKVNRRIAAILMTFGVGLSLVGCSSYAKGEVMEVEEDMGQNGPVLELEVAREAYEGAGAPDTYEVHVDADSDCEVGDIYPDCDK